jgi:hypothetical protein
MVYIADKSRYIDNMRESIRLMQVVDKVDRFTDPRNGKVYEDPHKIGVQATKDDYSRLPGGEKYAPGNLQSVQAAWQHPSFPQEAKKIILEYDQYLAAQKQNGSPEVMSFTEFTSDRTSRMAQRAADSGATERAVQIMNQVGNASVQAGDMLGAVTFSDTPSGTRLASGGAEPEEGASFTNRVGMGAGARQQQAAGGQRVDNTPSRPGHRKTDAAKYIDEYGKWGGALVGAMIGFSFGGPVGAFIGLILGIALANALGPALGGLIDKQFGPKPTPTPRVVRPTTPAIPPLTIDGTGSPVLDVKVGGNIAVTPPNSEPLTKTVVMTNSGLSADINYTIDSIGEGKTIMNIKSVTMDGKDVALLRGKALAIDPQNGTVDLSQLASGLALSVNEISQDRVRDINRNVASGLTDDEKTAKLSDAKEQPVTFTYQHAVGARITSVKLTGKLVEDTDCLGTYKFVVDAPGNAIPSMSDMGGRVISDDLKSLVPTSGGEVGKLEITDMAEPKAGQSLESYLKENTLHIQYELDSKLEQSAPVVPQSQSTPGLGAASATGRRH